MGIISWENCLTDFSQAYKSWVCGHALPTTLNNAAINISEMGYCQFERTNISFNYVTPYDNNAIILVGIPAHIHKKFVAILHYI